MAQDTSKYKDYVGEVGAQLKLYAFEAKERYHKDKSNEFNNGYYCAFHRVISYIIQQAEAMDIDLKELELDNIDPDKDLIS